MANREEDVGVSTLAMTSFFEQRLTVFDGVEFICLSRV